METVEGAKKRLMQADVRRQIADKVGVEPWFLAHQSEQTEKSSDIFFSALIPVKEVERSLSSWQWDLSSRETMPVRWTRYVGKREVEGYRRYSSERGVEPLIIWRDFYGMRPSYREVCEEFRLHQNLYHDAVNRRHVAFDDAGNEEDIIQYKEWDIRIKLHALRRFLADKKCYLASFFETVRYSSYSLAEMGLKPEQHIEKSGLTHYKFWTAQDDDFASSDKKTISIIFGKKLIAPLERKAITKVRREPHPDFIIGQSPDGNPILHTCDPEKLADYFGKNRGEPHYLTPVFFRLEVLQKYYANPEKYSVEDGYLRCGALWGLRLDNDHSRHVTVFLGDLGRDLPAAERDYWKSFNIAPDGKGISKVNWKRGFMSEFADPTQPSLRFKQVFEQFQNAHEKRRGWKLFKPLAQDDAHYFVALRVPLTRDQAEFDGQVLSLTKILIDSLNEREIARGLTFDKGDQGITKFEKYLANQSCADHQVHIRFLRNLQDLRSAAVAHRKSDNFKKVAKLFSLDTKDTITVFEDILRSATALIEFLNAGLLLPTNDSPPGTST